MSRKRFKPEEIVNKLREADDEHASRYGQFRELLNALARRKGDKGK